MIPDNRSQQGSLPPTIFLMGPTASGKTDLAIELCRELPCEIISVDSAMVYRGMDIGTAKPSPEEWRDLVIRNSYSRTAWSTYYPPDPTG